MRRLIVSVASAGLLTLGLSACGGEDEPATPDPAPAPAEEETTEDPAEPAPTADAGEAPTEATAPAEDETTATAPADDSATSAPVDGGQTGAAPEAGEDLELFCELANAPVDPEAPVDEFLADLEAMRAVAPATVRPHLDAFIGEIEKATPEEMEGIDLPAGADLEVVQGAAEGLTVEGQAACAGR